MSDDENGLESRISWPDLSAYGLKVDLCVLPGDRMILVAGPIKSWGIEANREFMETFGRRLEESGFERHKSGIWLKPRTTISAKAIKRAFPNVVFADKTRQEVVIDMRKAATAAPEPFSV